MSWLCCLQLNLASNEFLLCKLLEKEKLNTIFLRLAREIYSFYLERIIKEIMVFQTTSATFRVVNLHRNTHGIA